MIDVFREKFYLKLWKWGGVNVRDRMYKKRNDGSKRYRDLQIKLKDVGSYLLVCFDEIGIGN